MSKPVLDYRRVTQRTGLEPLRFDLPTVLIILFLSVPLLWLGWLLYCFWFVPAV